MEKVEPDIRLVSKINTTYDAFTATSGSNPTCAWRVIVLTLNPMGTAYQTSARVGSVGANGLRMRWRAGFMTIFGMPRLTLCPCLQATTLNPMGLLGVSGSYPY